MRNRVGDRPLFRALPRVPEGYGAPAQVTSTSGSPQLVMNTSPTYVQQLIVKLNRTGKRKLAALAKHHKRLRGKLTVVATDTVGNKTTASKTVKLK